MSWSPTHAAPESGLQAWSAPDPSQPPVATLDPHLEVQVVEWSGAWVRIVCSNGWEAWVDGRLLVARTPPVAATRRSSRGLLVGGSAALIVVIVLAVALSGRGDDHTKGAALVDLDVPTGWSVSKNGLVAAENAADLTTASPTGSRVRAVVGDEAVRDPKALLDEAVASDATLVEDPAEARVSGVLGVSVTLQEKGVVRKVIVVRPKSGEVVTFTLEAPAARYQSDKATLAAVPGLARPSSS